MAEMCVYKVGCNIIYTDTISSQKNNISPLFDVLLVWLHILTIDKWRSQKLVAVTVVK